MERSRTAYLILKNLYNGNILSAQELGINKNEYAEILGSMQKKDLISGVKITNLSQEEVSLNNKNEKITITGINYLMENTIIDRDYKIHVSVDEMLNGIELSTTVDANGITSKYKKVFNKPFNDIDLEAESLLLAVEGLKREKEKSHCC